MNVWSQGLVVLGLAVMAGPRVWAADEPASTAKPDAVCAGCHIKDNPDAFYKLKSDGRLQELDYEKDIRANSLLW